MSDFPSSLPGIDIASGLTRVAGNKNLYLKLLRHVAQDAQNTLDKLTSALAEGNTQAAREIAHSLKGAAANLSLLTITEAATNLEGAAKVEDCNAAMLHLDALRNAFTEYTTVVASLDGL